MSVSKKLSYNAKKKKPEFVKQNAKSAFWPHRNKPNASESKKLRRPKKSESRKNVSVFASGRKLKP